MYYTNAVKLHPTAWLIAEFAAANTASMVLFVGNPTNVVICEGFGINNVVYSAYTIFPFMACSVFCFAALAFQFHTKEHIPKRLDATEELNPLSVLHDPIGACVGAILLGSCLVVIIMVSFFGIDVWKISLPFAATKFIVDIGWDYWRDQNGRLTRPHKPGSQESDHATSSKDTGSLSSSRDSIPPKEPPSNTIIPPVPTDLTSSDEPRSFIRRHQSKWTHFRGQFDRHFPTLSTAFPRLPFALVPFAFSQFILIEALAHQGWIDIFATWLVRATDRALYPTVWIVGILGVFLCNLSGTNIGATILLTKVVRAANMPDPSFRAAAIALAVASNVGAVSFTFSASLAGLLWRGILEQKRIHIKQSEFAMWNLLPITVMTAVGLCVVCIEMSVLQR